MEVKERRKEKIGARKREEKRQKTRMEMHEGRGDEDMRKQKTDEKRREENRGDRGREREQEKKREREDWKENNCKEREEKRKITGDKDECDSLNGR